MKNIPPFFFSSAVNVAVSCNDNSENEHDVVGGVPGAAGGVPGAAGGVPGVGGVPGHDVVGGVPGAGGGVVIDVIVCYVLYIIYNQFYSVSRIFAYTFARCPTL